MSIFVDETTKVVYQGLTGSAGRFYGLRNRAYGTQVVAGTNPKRAGTDVEGIPVFATVKDAVQQTGATASCVFVPPPAVESAVMEAAEAGITFIAVITEGVYQALYELTQKGIGVTTCVGIGGDPVPGTTFIDCLEAFQADPETRAVMLIGEIGGSEEEKAAEFIGSKLTMPVVSYIAGVTAPPGKKMGHAGAIVSGSQGTAQAKMDALRKAGARVAVNPTEAGEMMAEVVAGLRR